MANAKSATKAGTVKRPTLVAVATPAKAKPIPKTKARPSAATKAVAAKPAKSKSKKPVAIPAEQRRHYIEVAAYHIAERRGFGPGDPLADWTQAEVEIDRLLAEGRLGG